MKYGVIGLGSIGTRHAVNLAALGKEVFGYDPEAQKKDWASAHGIELAESREALFSSVDALIIASPNAAHFGDLKEAVAAGCHIFAEKPLAAQNSGVEEVLYQASIAGQKIFAGLNLRFHPAVKAAKRILEEGKIGQPVWAIFQSSHYLPDWRPHQDYRLGYTSNRQTGGVLFDIIHEFDLANYFLGPASTVSAIAGNSGKLNIESEDCADIVLQHQDGQRSVLHLDYITRPTKRRAEIGGPDGVLHIDLVGRTCSAQEASGNVVADEDFKQINPDKDYIEEMRAFVACVEQGEAPICDGFEAFDVLQQVIAARKMAGLPSV